MFIFLSRFTELRKRTKLEAETKVSFFSKQKLPANLTYIL